MGRIILLILKGMGIVYGAQPRMLQFFWGSLLGAFLYRVKFKYSVVKQNLEIAYPHDERKRKKIARESYNHFGNLVFEVLMLFGPMKNFILKNVDVIGGDYVVEAHKRGKGLIFLSSHVGNWEIMGGTGGVIAQLDLMFVTKRLKPDWLHRAIEEGRRKIGVRATYEPRTMRDVLSHLKNNKTVGFVLDQYAGPPVGVRVPLFGVPVSTSTAVATLVKRTGATILPVLNYRRPDGRWVVHVSPPVEWKADSDLNYELALNTAEYTSTLEKHILAHPEQWLWIHRRFKGDLSPLREGEWREPRTRR